MIHLVSDVPRNELHHVYLEGARNLRDDLPS
jgi:chorismate mutase